MNQKEIEVVTELKGDEKVFKDLNMLYKRILQDESLLEDLIDTNVFILFGATGSGKSTLANALIQGKD